MIKIFHNFFLVFLTLLQLTFEGVDYIDQQSWGGVCINGTRQSPRDIPSIHSQNLMKCPINQHVQFIENSYTFLIDPDYTHALQSIFQTYTTVKHIIEGAQTDYDSLQFHWHFPSEHHIDGIQYDLQLHIVHVNSNGSKLAVIGLLFQISQVTHKFKDLFGEVDFTLGPTTVAFPFRIKNQIVYHYQGSLTTPPCSQTVQWFVHTNIYPIKKEWYDYIIKRINNGQRNDRDIQANIKPVYLMGPICNLKNFH